MLFNTLFTQSSHCANVWIIISGIFCPLQVHRETAVIAVIKKTKPLNAMPMLFYSKISD